MDDFTGSYIFIIGFGTQFIKRFIKTFINYPEYDPSTVGSKLYPHSHDISIVKLEDPIVSNLDVAPYIGRACLPKKSYNPPILAYASGWGLTKIINNTDGTITKIEAKGLRFVDIPIMSNEKCKAVPGISPWLISPSMLCAGPPEGYIGENVCKGDSGKITLCDQKYIRAKNSSIGQFLLRF